MTVTDRTAATEQEFRDRIQPFEDATTPPEVREAALRERVIEAMSWAETFDDGRIGRDGAAELLDQYLAAYRATQDGGAEVARLSPNGRDVAIRRGANDWRVSNGGHYRDLHVADWTPLAPQADR